MKFSILKLVRFAVIFAAAPAALATTWYVNGVKGSDTNPCSSTAACKTIGHAIALASSGDSIRVAAATYTENLTISKSLNVIGSGASTTIVDGGGFFSVITISPATTATVVLSGLTIRNGSGHFGDGGGIFNGRSSTLTINNSTVSGNVARGGRCQLGFHGELVCYGGSGGGIYSVGTLTINNSTISGNMAKSLDPLKFPFCKTAPCVPASGGGIAVESTLTINNSTISGNAVSRPLHKPDGSGGGIFNVGTATISNSTISGNSALDAGGGIFSGDTVKIQNSIVANNTGGNCSGSQTSDGYNLSSDSTCNFNGPGDMNNTKPMLGPLQNNGGPTWTMALLPGSPAIDAGNPGGCTDGSGHLLKTDQRGMPRPDTEDKIGCDIGAYESQGSLSAAVSNTAMPLSAPQVPLEKAAVTPAPTATLSPTNLTFSTQGIGTASAAKTVTLKNTGTASLSISSIAITGANSADFAQTHACGSSLAAGASCTISVIFKPTASGTSTAALSVSDNAAGSPQKVTLSGIGTTAKLSPTSLHFGSVGLGASLAKTVNLTNVGTTTLTITGIAITGTDAGDFAQTHTCESSLAPGLSCTIRVTFKPSVLGTRTAALSVRDNAAGSPQTVALSGGGVSGGTLSGLCLSFDPQNMLCRISSDTTDCPPGKPAIKPETAACRFNNINVDGATSCRGPYTRGLCLFNPSH